MPERKRKYRSGCCGARVAFWRAVLVVFCLIRIFVPEIVEAGAWILSGTQWTSRDEQTYSDFVRALGESGCGSLNKFVRNPRLNPFYAEEDNNFNLLPDCADLPYVVRAYVAYKLR
ncbi:MAG: hypothetical protein HQM09_22515, partial [Candidatus Riflebacteria bacterium]|nr:hypothetical protein [Candidatus Riflebacteria bacterium]